MEELEFFADRNGENTPNFTNSNLKEISMMKRNEIVEFRISTREENKPQKMSQKLEKVDERLSLTPPVEYIQEESYRIRERKTTVSSKKKENYLLCDLEELNDLLRKIASENIYPMKGKISLFI